MSSAKKDNKIEEPRIVDHVEQKVAQLEGVNRDDRLSRRMNCCVAVFLLFLFLVPLLVAAGVGVYLKYHAPSYCPLDPVIRYPCCKPKDSIFTEIIVTLPLFVGMLAPCLFLGNLLHERWSEVKYQREGKLIKGIVSDKKFWSTSHETPNHGTRTTCHYELTVRYPANGTTIISPSCSRIVTKKFGITDHVFYSEISTGKEIDLLRMSVSDGYDPRKALLVRSMSTTRTFYCKLCSLISIGVLWNSIWLLTTGTCIAFFWAWPFAISCAYFFLGPKTMCCASGRFFKNERPEGDIVNRFDNNGADDASGITADTNESNSDQSPFTPSLV